MLGGLVLLPFAAIRMKNRKAHAAIDCRNLSTSAVIFSSNPVFVALFAWLILSERIHSSKIIGMLVGIAGVIILFSDRLGLSFASAEGPLLIFGSAVVFALYTVLGKRLTLGGTDSLVMTSLSFTAGSLMLLPAMLIMKIPVMTFNAGMIPLILADSFAKRSLKTSLRLTKVAVRIICLFSSASHVHRSVRMIGLWTNVEGIHSVFTSQATAETSQISFAQPAKSVLYYLKTERHKRLFIFVLPP